MNKAVIISVSVVVGILVVALIVFLVVRAVRLSKIRKSDEEANERVEQSAGNLSTCFGGNDNIVSISQQGSRVTVLLKNPELIDKEAIDKELSSVMYMGSKVVFVIGSKSEEFSRLLKENIDKQK